MKKNLYSSIVIGCMLFSTSCNDKKPNVEPVDTNAYSTFESDNFKIDFPSNWEVDSIAIQTYAFRPFSASSENQVVNIGTRLVGTMSLEDFVEERINSFAQTQKGFHLLSKEIKDGQAIIHYENIIRHENTDENQSIEEDLLLGTTMRIDSINDKFYGIDCFYATEAEKDTAEHIINSLRFN